MKVFIDTSAYIAYYNIRDKNHVAARSFMKKVFEGEYGPIIFYTSDYVFDEVITVILRLTRNKQLAVKVGKYILESRVTRIINVDEEIFSEAWKLFIKYRDKMWSFTDCTSFIIMNRLDIKNAFTFDKHFKQAGYKTLP